jgi:hypothetical protein
MSVSGGIGRVVFMVACWFSTFAAVEGPVYRASSMGFLKFY